jgi:prepilin-type N-terminal cleavage/methylation domain-containing protein
MRRGETLLEVMAAVVIFSIAIGSFGTEWVHTRQQQALIRQEQVAARITERTLEEARAVGSGSMPNQASTAAAATPWRTAYFDAFGASLSSQAEGGYVAKTWVSYLPNDSRFTDGSAGRVNSGSLREVTVRVYQSGDPTPCMDCKTMVAALASSN